LVRCLENSIKKNISTLALLLFIQHLEGVQLVFLCTRNSKSSINPYMPPDGALTHRSRLQPQPMHRPTRPDPDGAFALSLSQSLSSLRFAFSIVPSLGETELGDSLGGGEEANISKGENEQAGGLEFFKELDGNFAEHDTKSQKDSCFKNLDPYSGSLWTHLLLLLQQLCPIALLWPRWVGLGV
jgi:hypothetical protein